MRACGRTSTKPIACSRASWCWRARSADSWARRHRCRWRTSSATHSPVAARRSPPSRSNFDSNLAPACVAGSETLLTRMVDNLLDNAVRHNLPQGLINVTCEADLQTARLVVESGGSVLRPGGRRAARRTVQATGGRAHRLAAERARAGALDRRCGRGRARRRAHALPPRARRIGSRDHAAGRSRCGRHERFGMRVLVVEDAPRLANWIAEGLRDQAIAVDVAYDGAEAARKLHVNPYDVVVLDRDLPGIHGDALCKMITESDEPAMILMLTAAGCARRAGDGTRARRRRLPAQAVPFP